jgi:hypothetical protein
MAGQLIPVTADYDAWKLATPDYHEDCDEDCDECPLSAEDAELMRRDDA